MFRYIGNFIFSRSEFARTQNEMYNTWMIEIHNCKLIIIRNYQASRGFFVSGQAQQGFNFFGSSAGFFSNCTATVWSLFNGIIFKFSTGTLVQEGFPIKNIAQIYANGNNNYSSWQILEKWKKHFYFDFSG